MAAYMLSFALADQTINGRDYGDRWEALNDCIKALAPNLWWAETTAFLAFETEYTIDQIANEVRGEIALGYDLVLIRSLESKNARIIGALTDQDIFKLMPYLKRA